MESLPHRSITDIKQNTSLPFLEKYAQQLKVQVALSMPISGAGSFYKCIFQCPYKTNELNEGIFYHTGNLFDLI
jgi:hypothetical protein